MAFGGTITYRGEGETSYAATTFDDADTFTPAVNDIIMVAIHHVDGDDRVNAPTASAWGITFSQKDVVVSSSRTNEIWIGRVTVSASDAVSCTKSIADNSSYLSVIQISGAKTDGTPASVLGQTLEDVAYEPTSPHQIGTFASFTADSATLFYSRYSTTMTYTTPSGYTSLSNYWYWRSDADLTPDMTFSSRNNYAELLSNAYEVLAAAGGSIIPQIMHHRRQMAG